MKKIIVILSITLILLGIAAGILVSRRQHTVSDFEIFPCRYGEADQIDITGIQKTQFKKAGQTWALSQPVQEPMEQSAAQQLEQFMHARMLVDDHAPQKGSPHQKLTTPTIVSFSKNNKEICTFELGTGEKYATVDSERRWIFMGDQAYRTFVPLMDFGPMFEQPVSAWRMREFFKLGTADIISIELWSAREHFKVDRQGSPTADNPQGWRMVSASANDNPVETAHFELDERRIATVVELMTPFMVDDWADGLSQLEIASFQFGGGITVGAKDRAYRIQIGPEVDFTQHPEWMPAGEGARYIRVEGDKRIGIISSRRLLGIFPSLDDMRTKRVWDADSTHLAAIEVQVGSHCLRYKPQRANVWESAACLSSETAIEAKAIPDKELANYAKVINALQAVRYATPEEKADISLKSAEVRLYMDAPDHLAYRLTLSDSIKNLYRYAQVWRGNVDGSEELGPIFVLSEGICRLLLSDLTAQ